MSVSDALSRAYIKNSKPEFDENSLIHHVHFVFSNLFISNERLKQFKEETRKDPILQTLIKYTIEGWPKKTLISYELHPYFTHCSDISYHEGLLLKDQRIIVPIALRSEMKSILHLGHLGIENCKKRARQALFWPLINKELEDMISKCPTCLTYINCQPSETPIKREIPDHPWTKCAANLFRLQGHYYLLIVDYYSKFIAVENLQNPQSETVINKCKKVFSQFGIPKELITDNDLEFSSHKFRSFSKTWDILHKTISPHYHQSNGLAERSIQTFKRTLIKAKHNSEDHFLAMLSLNSLPDQNETSPAEKLHGHKLRTTLPSLIPSIQSTVAEKHTITQNLGSNLHEIAPGKAVRIRADEQNIWDKKGIVVSQNNRPRSYDILNERGNILTRNRRHPLPTTEKFNIKHDYDNAIPVNNTSIHPILMIDNQHEKPALEDIYRTKSGRTVKKPKRYIDEM